MKKILMIAILFSILETSAHVSVPQPFAPYNDGVPYRARWIENMIANDLARLEAYQQVLQFSADYDGWGKFIPNGEVTREYTLIIVGQLQDRYMSWSKSDHILIGSMLNGTCYWFKRPSYSNRPKRIVGSENVKVMNISRILGIYREDGSDFPERIVACGVCANAVWDMRFFKQIGEIREDVVIIRERVKERGYYIWNLGGYVEQGFGYVVDQVPYNNLYVWQLGGYVENPRDNYDIYASNRMNGNHCQRSYNNCNRNYNNYNNNHSNNFRSTPRVRQTAGPRYSNYSAPRTSSVRNVPVRTTNPGQHAKARPRR